MRLINISCQQGAGILFLNNVECLSTNMENNVDAPFCGSIFGLGYRWSQVKTWNENEELCIFKKLVTIHFSHMVHDF